MPNYFYYDGACRLLSLLCAALCFFVILMPYTALLIRRITRLSRDMEVLAGGDLSTRWCPGAGRAGRAGPQHRGDAPGGARADGAGKPGHPRQQHADHLPLPRSAHPPDQADGYLDILQHGKFRDEGERRSTCGGPLTRPCRCAPCPTRCSAISRCGRNPRRRRGGRPWTARYFWASCWPSSVLTWRMPASALEPPVPDGDYRLYIRTEDICRVFDNLFSNLKKYGRSRRPHPPGGTGGGGAGGGGAGKPAREDPPFRQPGHRPAHRPRPAGAQRRPDRDHPAGEEYRTTVWLPKAAREADSAE